MDPENYKTPKEKKVFLSSVAAQGILHKDMTKEQRSQHRREYYRANKHKITAAWRKKRA